MNPSETDAVEPGGIVAQGTRLQALADLYPDGILGIAQPSGVVSIINEHAAHLLGCPVGWALGQPAAEVLRLQDHEGHGWLEWNHPLDRLSITHGIPEQSWINQAGEEVLTTARLIRDVPGGPVVGLSLALRSGRGRARLDQERSDLVATVSHELRSPLSGVKGSVQVMLNRWDQLKDEQKKLMLQTVHSDADRLSRLISELLDVARIDTGRLSISPRPIDLNDYVDRCVESVQAAASSREIVTDLAEDLPRIWADPDRFTQIATNLLENAVRHGDGTVTVRTHAAGDGASLVVEDQGPGIPDEMRRRVRTKYWTGGSGGSGLGLYLVDGLVRAHDAQLDIDSAAGGGARLAITWPPPPPD